MNSLNDVSAETHVGREIYNEANSLKNHKLLTFIQQITKDSVLILIKILYHKTSYL